MDLAGAFKEITVIRGENGQVDIKPPVLMWVANTYLELRVTPKGDGGYIVCCTDDYFTEANGPQSRYFNIFMKHHGSRYAGIEVRCDIIYKEFPGDYNPVVAVDEMIRFFIAFDDFSGKVIGYESDYE